MEASIFGTLSGVSRESFLGDSKVGMSGIHGSKGTEAMTKNSEGATANHNKTPLYAGQTTEISVVAGQSLDIAGNASLSHAETAADGTLTLNFSNGATLIVKNFSTVSAMQPPPVLHFANGQQIALVDVVHGLASAPEKSAQPVADQDIIIAQPKTHENIVVTLEKGQDYKFGFALSEADTVVNKDGQLVITFKDGGGIIIPNYGTAPHGAHIFLDDGKPLAAVQQTHQDSFRTSSASDSDSAASAQSLAAIEPAAGGAAAAGGGAAPGGFGFQSAFRPDSIFSLNPIGPIDPTALQFQSFDRPFETNLLNQIITAAVQANDVQVDEDGSVALDLTATPSSAQEQITLTVEGILPGWTLDTSTSGGTFDTATGTWTITLPAGTAFKGGPTLSPPPDSDADMPNLIVTETVTDTNTGQTATATATFDVVTDAVADAPELVVSGGPGAEDSSVSINIATSPADTDGSEQIGTITVSGVPAGATLNHGVLQANGDYILTTADLDGLRLTPAPDFSGTVNLTITSVVNEVNLSGQEINTANNQNQTTRTLAIDIAPVADQPNLEVQDAQVKEDGSVQLNVSASLNDADDSGTLTVTITGFQPGWTVDTTTSGGVYNSATGTWTLSLPAGTTSFTGGPVIHPPANSDVDLTGLTVTATSTEQGNGSTSHTTDTINVVVDAVADAVTVTAQNANGSDNTPVALAINVGASSDTDGSETTEIIISGVPAGATLNHGTFDAVKGEWHLTRADLSGLVITPVHGSSASFDLTVKVRESERVTSTTPGNVENDFSDNVFTAQTTLHVSITDAVPVAHDDSAAWGTAADGTSGNVITNDTLSDDAPNTVSSITFGGTSVSVPASGTATIVGDHGTLHISANGDFTYTPNVTPVTGAPVTIVDDFTYTLRDADGDTSTAHLNVRGQTPSFVVGSNANDAGSTTADYKAGSGHGTITGGTNADILVGDAGGATTVNQIKDYNIELVLDVSGSMGKLSDVGSKYDILVKAVDHLLRSLHDYDGGKVIVNIDPFDTKALQGGTFDVTSSTGLAQALDFLRHMGGGGSTNYESALQAANKWLSGTGPTPGASTLTYFISDGEPNHFVSPTNPADTVKKLKERRAMDEILGVTDGTNEVAVTKSLSDEVIGIGIDIGPKITNLDKIASSGHAINVTDPTKLDSVLQAASPLNKIAGVGADRIIGGGGDDLIFGDGLNTDALATAQGLNMNAGSSWDVFEALEAGQGTKADWSRADTIAYIQSHAQQLAVESHDSQGAGRLGGDDILEGGTGNDTIFGQEGNDSINGGVGNNHLFGGTGADTFHITHAPGQGVDTIHDFSTTGGDILDISTILTGFDPLHSDLHNFLSVTNSGGNTIVQVDVTGSGHAFQNIAILEGLTIDLDTLVNHSKLIA